MLLLGHHLEVCFCNGEQTLVKPCILKDKSKSVHWKESNLKKPGEKSRKAKKKRHLMFEKGRNVQATLSDIRMMVPRLGSFPLMNQLSCSSSPRK